LTGEVKWQPEKLVDEPTAAKLQVKFEESQDLLLQGSFISDTSAAETKPFLEFAVRKLVGNAQSYIVVAFDSCTSPSSCTVSISQTITDSCKLYFCFEDASSALIPILWHKQSWTSGSGTQTFTFYQQLATGLITVSGSPSAAAVSEWIVAFAGDNWNFWDTPINHWDPACPVTSPQIQVANTDTMNSKNFGIGLWTPKTEDSDPDVMAPTGVIESVTSSSAAVFNTSNHATTIRVYVNLSTDYSVGQLMSTSLPAPNLLLSDNCFAWGSTKSYTLNEPSAGTYTLS